MIIVAIPSKGRAGNVRSLRPLGAELRAVTRIFCPESEASLYQERHGAEIASVVAVPDSIKGITRTRNFILEYCEREGERWCVQCDDDAYRWSYFEANTPTPGIALPDERKLPLLVNFFEMTEDLGTNLFGFQVSDDPKFYREYSPFSFTSPVVGNLMGIVVGDGQRFDERLLLKEDYDFSLQSLHRYRRILRGNKYTWRVEHQETPGGCRSYRTLRAEQDAIETLECKWGSKVIRRHKKKMFEIVVKCPIKGI
jgi:hypothetical protein